jgi:purine-binding chemotaxis protein CheW
MTMNPEQTAMYVTATIGGQLFGLPVARVQDVFVPERMTPVPLAAPEVAGLINLRGRIVTMLEMRRRLGLPEGDLRQTPIAIGVEWHGESYGLLIDEIGEVLTLPAARCEAAPANLDARMAQVTAGVHRLDDGLMMVLDVDRVVDGASGAHLV